MVNRLHIVMGIIRERRVIIFHKWGVMSSMSDCCLWVGGVVVHEHGVVIVHEQERGNGAVIAHEWGIVIICEWLSFMGEQAGGGGSSVSMGGHCSWVVVVICGWS
jgi:hypothetical protein